MPEVVCRLSAGLYHRRASVWPVYFKRPNNLGWIEQEKTLLYVSSGKLRFSAFTAHVDIHKCIYGFVHTFLQTKCLCCASRLTTTNSGFRHIHLVIAKLIQQHKQTIWMSEQEREEMAGGKRARQRKKKGMI